MIACVCDVEGKQAEESSSALPTLSQPILLRLYSQDSPALYVKDVTSLKDQQNRPLMTLIGPVQLQSSLSSSTRRGNQTLLMFVPPQRPRWPVCYWVGCGRCRGNNGQTATNRWASNTKVENKSITTLWGASCCSIKCNAIKKQVKFVVFFLRMEGLGGFMNKISI